MFHAPDWYENVSLRLSEVLDDISVNERMVLKTRRANLLQESISTIAKNFPGSQCSVYKLGSQSECTTTIGLVSDSDILSCENNYSVIQDWAEWIPSKSSLMMICDESTPPGYCYLQVLRRNVPRPATEVHDNNYGKDKHGRVLMKNTIFDKHFSLIEGLQRQGPSAAYKGIPGYADQDRVFTFPFQSWPQPARHWLELVHSSWPNATMKRYAATSDCFVVPTGSCVSEHKVFQWRISTSLAERCLMFNLNITQIRCYILLKMILKTFINLHGQTHISSYMCKTVLLHCIMCKPSHVWKDSKILNCLIYCLSTLNECILCGNCPHFIICGNNLMAGKITAENKPWLLNQMSKLIQNTAGSLLGIQIDKFGQRLFMKLGIIHDADYNAIYEVENALIPTCLEGLLLWNTANCICCEYDQQLVAIKNKSLETQIDHLLQSITTLVRYHNEGNSFVQKACRSLAPIFCTAVGSLMASYNIKHNKPVSPQALRWLSARINSDVSSGRLKLASVFYCTGDMERAASILEDSEELYNIHVVQPICLCYMSYHPFPKIGFAMISTRYNEEGLRYITAFCIRFLPSEINCIPKELQYELFRSTEEELLHREKDDVWMDLAAVDSSPYLYFLQYKTYRNLQRVQDQQQALNNLLHVTVHEENLKHRETAWNLLGQCMEQENRPLDALWCYKNSAHVRKTNNVARIHICRLLASLIAPVTENNLELQHRHMRIQRKHSPVAI